MTPANRRNEGIFPPTNEVKMKNETQKFRNPVTRVASPKGMKTQRCPTETCQIYAYLFGD